MILAPGPPGGAAKTMPRRRAVVVSGIKAFRFLHPLPSFQRSIAIVRGVDVNLHLFVFFAIEIPVIVILSADGSAFILLKITFIFNSQPCKQMFPYVAKGVAGARQH